MSWFSDIDADCFRRSAGLGRTSREDAVLRSVISAVILSARHRTRTFCTGGSINLVNA